MRSAMVIGAFAVAVLVLVSAAATPHFFEGGFARWVGVPAVMAMVLAYAVAGYFGVPALARGSDGVARVAATTGCGAGGLYATEIALEYVLQPADNTPWGLVEFGAVFALMALAGSVLAWRTGRLRPALAGGLWTGLIGALIWYGVLLGVSFLFRGTSAQAAVFRAEGDYADFARSGMSDFKVFTMQDLLGAGFYHLLLSPVFGLILGGLGAAPSLIVRRIRPRDGR